MIASRHERLISRLRATAAGDWRLLIIMRPRPCYLRYDSIYVVISGALRVIHATRLSSSRQHALAYYHEDVYDAQEQSHAVANMLHEYHHGVTRG